MLLLTSGPSLAAISESIDFVGEWSLGGNMEGVISFGQNM